MAGDGNEGGGYANLMLAAPGQERLFILNRASNGRARHCETILRGGVLLKSLHVGIIKEIEGYDRNSTIDRWDPAEGRVVLGRNLPISFGRTTSHPRLLISIWPPKCDSFIAKSTYSCGD